LPRKELTGFLAAGVIILVAAIFALRFDLASLLFPYSPVPASSDAKQATETKRASAIAAKVDLTSRLLPEGEQAVVPGTSKFDVVRIDPDGASVFAGRAPANAQVTVLANDQPVASAKADANGEWATVIERRFASGDYQLSLRAKPNGPEAETAGQSVRITIAANTRPPVASDAKAVVAVAGHASAPAPITFVYDDTQFTSVGRKEAAALNEFLRQRQLNSVTLTGHADSRGSDEYNMELSRQRLETVARFLREAGYTGKLELIPKGKQEPFVSPDRDRLPKEDAFQLDRRVELRFK
jgi:outer membrane protein OmpA-like peptidoglycan-associated protein